MKIRVRPAAHADDATWLRMRRALWPDGSEAEHRAEIERYFSDSGATEPMAALLAEDPDGRVLGFVELSVRPFAEGCTTSRVAYLEGWFVEAGARKQGVGRALVSAAEAWGRARGCRELASDAEVENDVSLAAHQALGFTDVGVVRCFRKDL